MAKRTRAQKPATPTKFQVGDKVRVKPGVRDIDYPDIPLGGWAGVVVEIEPGHHYEVRWSRETLDHIHPVIQKRCQRDGLVLEEYGLAEEELEPDRGGPLQMEQPGELASRPLSPKDEGDRLRMALGLSSDDPLPDIDDDAFSGHSLPFGSDLERMFDSAFQEAKMAFEELTAQGNAPVRTPKKPQKSKKPGKKGKRGSGGSSRSPEVQAILEQVIAKTDAFCKEALNQEYAQLCRELTETLAREDPSPLLRGRVETWAAGIVRTLGWVNFLDDPERLPYMKLSEINPAFGVSESASHAKFRAIRTLLDLTPFDPRWTLPSLMDDNPLVWVFEVNGLLMDLRLAPREVQELAFQEGLIPYIPADPMAENEEPWPD